MGQGEKPRWIAQDDIDKIRSTLRKGNVVSRYGDPDFNSLGIFEILDRALLGCDRLSGFGRTLADELWSEELLYLDPNTHRLETRFRGDIQVLDRQGGFITSIPPIMIRFIDEDSCYGGIVRESGYILQDRTYTLSRGKCFSVQEIEKILLQTERGIKPPGFDYKNAVYAKVNPGLVGRSFLTLVFSSVPRGSKGIWERDGVVIDPDTRTLVSRIISQPFTAERWGETL